VHADEADLVEAAQGGAHGAGLALGRGRGPQRDELVHGVVAENAHARVADDLATGHVGHVGGQQVEDGLRDPGAVHVDAVKHHVGAGEAGVGLEVLLGGRNRCQRLVFLIPSPYLYVYTRTYIIYGCEE